jgi:hypothetical protein
MNDPNTNSRPEPSKPPTNPRIAYKPLTLEDLRQNEDGFFKDLNTPFAKGAAAILFAVIYFLGRNSYFMSPLLIVILLACVLYRMNARERAIAGIPATIAAIRLGMGLADDFTLNRVSNHPNLLPMQAPGVTWVPLFLAACLFYSPWKLSRTSRAVFWQSLVYLMAGLLPTGGSFVVSTVITFGLFFVITLTLILDLSSSTFTENLPIARPLEGLPIHG